MLLKVTMTKLLLLGSVLALGLTTPARACWDPGDADSESALGLPNSTYIAFGQDAPLYTPWGC
jgi:hypothetical protein